MESVSERTTERHDAVIVEILYAVMVPVAVLLLIAGAGRLLAAAFGIDGDPWVSVGHGLYLAAVALAAQWTMRVLWQARTRGL